MNGEVKLISNTCTPEYGTAGNNYCINYLNVDNPVPIGALIRQALIKSFPTGKLVPSTIKYKVVDCIKQAKNNYKLTVLKDKDEGYFPIFYQVKKGTIFLYDYDYDGMDK
jgi:hypothetical protein